MRVDEHLNNVPSDWENPDFDSCSMVHEWKNYVTSEVQEIWHTFTKEQKQLLAECFNSSADNEEWD